MQLNSHEPLQLVQTLSHISLHTLLQPYLHVYRHVELHSAVQPTAHKPLHVAAHPPLQSLTDVDNIDAVGIIDNAITGNIFAIFLKKFLLLIFIITILFLLQKDQDIGFRLFEY